MDISPPPYTKSDKSSFVFQLLCLNFFAILQMTFFVHAVENEKERYNILIIYTNRIVSWHSFSDIYIFFSDALMILMVITPLNQQMLDSIIFLYLTRGMDGFRF